MAVVVVANPTAGRGKGARLIPKVDALLRSLGVSHTLRICEGADDPERLAKVAASDGTEIVAALGGDGHVGACANGLFGTESALAVIPAGTGNDFARHIGGAGFDSEVSEHANRVRRLRGAPKYVYSTFVTLARFSPGDFVVRVDGKEHAFRGMMLAVGNGTSYGGGMRVTPDARSDDGLLDVCVIQELPKWQFVKTFPKVFSGKHVEHRAVTMLRGREIEMTADRPFQVYADGEPVGRLPAMFSVVPSALRVIVPPS